MEFIKKSIGLKIFSIVSVIIFLMLGIAVVNVRIEKQVGRVMERVSLRYIPAYGALSLANLRLAEQAIYLRTGMTGISFDLTDQLKETIQEQIRLKGNEFWNETKSFHDLINLELDEENAFADKIKLARIDQKVEEIKAMQRSYENDFKAFTEILNKGDLNTVSALLPHLENRRREFNESFDTARMMMLTATQDAAKRSLKLQKQRHIISLILVSLGSVLALIFAWFITKSLTQPVKILLKGTQTVIKGDLSVSLPVTTRDEIGRLTEAFNNMTAELQKGNRVRDMFGKYIDPRIVKNLIEKPEIRTVDGERQVMTILFSDIRGFSELSEGLTPKTLVKILNRYFTLMSEAIHENGGVIDKFIGDAVMAYWGKPFNTEGEHAYLACRAALAMQSKLEIFRSELPELLGLRRNVPEIYIGIGIATGDVVVGNLGSDKTKNYTVIGDTVNFASRLESTNKSYGTRLLVSEETADMVGQSLNVREIDTIIVPGKNEAKRVFEIIGYDENNTSEFADRFSEGLLAYRKTEWERAAKAFTDCLKIHPDDPPSLVFLKRLEYFSQNPPGKDWDGVWVITEK